MKKRAPRRNAVTVVLLSLAAAAWVLATSLSGRTSTPGNTEVKPLLSKDLLQLAGKELAMLTVEYGPGASDPVHRHHAQALVYVLEGSIVMQLKDAAPVTLTAGQTFYEGPDDVHVIGRNASRTAPAKFLVFLVKDKDAPILVPAN